MFSNDTKVNENVNASGAHQHYSDIKNRAANDQVSPWAKKLGMDKGFYPGMHIH